MPKEGMKINRVDIKRITDGKFIACVYCVNEPENDVAKGSVPMSTSERKEYAYDTVEEMFEELTPFIKKMEKNSSTY